VHGIVDPPEDVKGSYLPSVKRHGIFSFGAKKETLRDEFGR
jgi:hypothetical protein